MARRTRHPVSRFGGSARAVISGVVAALAGGGAFAACAADAPTGEPADASVATDRAAPAPRDAAKPSLCIDGKPGPYPKVVDVDFFATMPPLSFPLLGGGRYDFAARFEPCAPKSKILLVRQTAAFCGPCQWSHAHTNELVPADVASRVEMVDLVVSDRNNFAVRTDDDLARAVAELGPHAPLVGADPAYTMQSVALGDRRLPFFVLVDSRTMAIRSFLPDPDPERLGNVLRREVALLDGEKRGPVAASALVDGVFERHHWDLLQGMGHPGPAPPDPTNAVADVPAAAALGKALFSDPRLSSNGAVACATCHRPSAGYADGLVRARGVGEGDRNTPTILYSSHARFQFWDGRTDTAWLQAVGPLENPLEMSSTRLEVARVVLAHYAERYAAIFPASPLPPLGDTTRFPARGKPGDAAWDTMAEADKAAVTAVLVRVGKLLAAFERTVTAERNALDAYLAGDRGALSPSQKRGLATFFTAGCAQCHYGSRLTDDAFHNIRFATARRDGLADRGAAAGLPLLAANPLRTAAYADGPFRELTVPAFAPELVGAFRTPTLRAAALTAPYGHGGSVATFPEIVRHYAFQGLATNDPRAVGDTERWVSIILEDVRGELAAALSLFTSPIVE